MRLTFFVRATAILLAIELISWLAFNNPIINTVAFISVLLVVLLSSCYKLEYGVYAIIGELAIGSQGHLLNLDIGSLINVPLRYGLFLIVMLAWLITVIKERKIIFFKLIFWRWYVALVVCFGLGILIGYLNGNQLSNIYNDVNGYLFFVLILPFSQALVSKQQIEKVLLVVLAGVAVLTGETILLLFLYSHRETFINVLPLLYRWLRDWRIAEITLHENGFTRIFLQSQLYVVLVMLLSLAALLQKYCYKYLAVFGTTSILIFISYSRSFWVGAIAALGLVGLYLLFVKKIKLFNIIKLYGSLLLVFVLGYVIVLGIINVPLFGMAGSNVSAESLFSERTDNPADDAAGGSRMALLKPLFNTNLQYPILGAGFGKTVTYKTLEPRILEKDPNGLLTTFSFEWGYLDLWLKLGIIGLCVYLLILGKLLYRGYGLMNIVSGEDNIILTGTWLAVVALLVIHIFTPFLNHPLGIGLILLFICFINIYAANKITAR
ncbi:MAG: O-antigen ligase family protein [Patescibacteria group bacterium]|jgi:hypothetical protein